MSQAEYGRHRGVSQQAVSKAVRSGRIPTTHGKIDPVAADLAWEAYTDLTKPRNSVIGNPAAGGDAGSKPTEARKWAAAHARREAALARIAELDHKARAGESVSRKDAQRIGFEAAREARDALLAIPDRISPILAGLTDAAEIHRVLSAEIVAACGGLSANALSRDPTIPGS